LSRGNSCSIGAIEKVICAVSWKFVCMCTHMQLNSRHYPVTDNRTRHGINTKWLFRADFNIVSEKTSYSASGINSAQPGHSPFGTFGDLLGLSLLGAVRAQSWKWCSMVNNRAHLIVRVKQRRFIVVSLTTVDNCY